MQTTTDFSSLQNKTIVITGASSGVGRAAAIEFAKHKATLFLAARGEKALYDAAEECKEWGANANAIVTDVTNANDVKALAKAAIERSGKIDVWINNAGVLAAGDFDKTPVQVHTQVIQTNLIGYVHGAHAAVQQFIKQGYGTLINNISVGGWVPIPFGVGYSASKYGIRGFSEALRGELAKYKNIHVCDLFPAFLDTPGTQHAGNYTGVVLKPAPPVYDPQKVARAMVQLAVKPKDETTIGSVATLLRLAHFVSPKLSRNFTALFMKSYFNEADKSPVTSGNLFEPVEYGTSIYGGWNSPADAAVRNKRLAIAGLLFAGVTAGLWMMNKKKK
ncbi:MAG: SDR family oxidoreductase [Bacteroidota bacterium]|nr:SDR family oxidoreductase [Bacteroidota bacterium]